MLKPEAPKSDADSATFWEGCQRDELLYQHCLDCRRAQFYPRDLCSRCQGRRLEWRRSRLRGEVYSFTVVERPPNRSFQPPYVVALVDLEEGFRMMLNLKGCGMEEVTLGMAVEVFFEESSRGEGKLPQARPLKGLESDRKTQG